MNQSLLSCIEPVGAQLLSPASRVVAIERHAYTRNDFINDIVFIAFLGYQRCLGSLKS